MKIENFWDAESFRAPEAHRGSLPEDLQAPRLRAALEAALRDHWPVAALVLTSESSGRATSRAATSRPLGPRRPAASTLFLQYFCYSTFVAVLKSLPALRSCVPGTEINLLIIVL